MLWIEDPNILDPNPAKNLTNWLTENIFLIFLLDKFRKTVKKSTERIDIELINEFDVVKKV